MRWTSLRAAWVIGALAIAHLGLVGCGKKGVGSPGFSETRMGDLVVSGQLVSRSSDNEDVVILRVTLEWFGDPLAREKFAPQIFFGTCSKNGRFSIRCQPDDSEVPTVSSAGQCRLESVDGAGWYIAPLQLPVDQPWGDVNFGEVACVRTSWIGGIIAGMSGGDDDPLLVVAERQPADNGDHVMCRTARVGRDGSFWIVGLPPGVYRVFPVARSLSDRTQSWITGMKRIQIEENMSVFTYIW